ncbi:MAG TPA: ABC transporter ATP-binding protein [Polyangia bacterium]|jgi:ABC-type sugar transport system ATPase subunit
MTTALSFDRVGKRYDQTVVLDDVTLETAPGELVVLVGPSGCGKSTLLRMVAGLETITDGEIRAAGRVLNEVPPQDRGVGMVFQSYALYPHMTVRENLAFPLYVKRATKAATEQAVAEVAALLGLGPLLERFPRQLSGGQRQRVAIGRCLVRRPEIYCFDEPLSNLDAALRSQIRVEIRALQRQLQKTTLYVTHDQVEAMTLADRIVVLDRGRVQQVGAPKELYLRPANRFVARFIGTPSMNVVHGEINDGRFVSGALAAPVASSDREAVLGVRVEDVMVLAGADADAQGPFTFPAVIGAIEPVGESGYLHLAVPGAQVEGDAAPPPGRSPAGEEAPAAKLLVASVPGHAIFGYRVGDAVRVRLKAERCHTFDPTTGRTLRPAERVAEGGP